MPKIPGASIPRAIRLRVTDTSYASYSDLRTAIFFSMTKINSDDNAVWWTSGLAVDADGAPNAYGPDNSGLDYTADAGSTGNWYGVVTDSSGEPVVQGPTDPCPGFYVSTTSLSDASKAKSDPTRYVDSNKICYVVIPSNELHDHGLHLGDVALVHCQQTGQASAAIVADVGPKNHYGEGSMALARALGLNDSPKHGGTDHGVTCVIFRGTSKGWPRTNVDIAQQVQDLINSLGGFEQYLE